MLLLLFYFILFHFFICVSCVSLLFVALLNTARFSLSLPLSVCFFYSHLLLFMSVLFSLYSLCTFFLSHSFVAVFFVNFVYRYIACTPKQLQPDILYYIIYYAHICNEYIIYIKYTRHLEQNKTNIN